MDKGPKKNKKNEKVVDSYKINTEEQRKKEDTINEKIDVFVEELKYRLDNRRKKKEKLKDLGLHEDFDPKRTYDVKSRQVAIKTWKDFFVVYLAMILVIFFLIWYLVEAGYLLNPLDDLMGVDNTIKMSDPILLPVVNRDSELEDSVSDITNYVLVESPEEEEEVGGKIVIIGETSSNFRYLTVSVLDSSNNELGNQDVALTIYDSDHFPWETVVDIVKSPASVEGVIQVLGVDIRGRELVHTHPITFSSKTVPETITLYTPVENQMVMEDTVLNILAEVNSDMVGDYIVRILDTEGSILYEDDLFIEGEYASGAFVVPEMREWGSAGTLQILIERAVLIETEVRFQQ